MKVMFEADNNGKSSVLEFISKFNNIDQAKILACLSSIENFEIESLRLIFKKIKNNLWDVAIKTEYHIPCNFHIYQDFIVNSEITSLVSKTHFFMILVGDKAVFFDGYIESKKKDFDYISLYNKKINEDMHFISLNDLLNQNSSDINFMIAYKKEMLMTSISAAIFEMRNASHLTKKELSKKSGVSCNIIDKIENCKNGVVPSFNTIVKLAAASNVDIKIQCVKHQLSEVKNISLKNDRM